jgi:drug/metabolite transporter (DMT)-like permease
MTQAGKLQVPALETVVSLRWIFAYLIVLGALVAVLSWNSGVRMLGAVNGVLFFNFVPITTFTVGVLNGQPLHAVEVTGAALVIGGLIANNLYLRREQREVRVAVQPARLCKA